MPVAPPMRVIPPPADVAATSDVNRRFANPVALSRDEAMSRAVTASSGSGASRPRPGQPSSSSVTTTFPRA